MTIQTLILTFFCWLPAISSLCCLLFILLLKNEKNYEADKKLYGILIAYFLILAIEFSFVVLYNWYPLFVIYLAFLLFGAFLFEWVFLYRIILLLTSSQTPPFSRIHYYLPLFIALIYFIWLLFLPVDQLLTLSVDGLITTRTQFYVFFIPTILAALYLFVYLFLSFYRFIHYRRSLNKTQLKDRKFRLRWLYSLLLLSSVSIVPAIQSLITLSWSSYYSDSLLIWAVVYVGIQLIMIYNVLNNNYPSRDGKFARLYTPSKKFLSIFALEVSNEQEGYILTKKAFDRYFATNKPHLDPQLKLSDLAVKLQISRTTLSNFVNRTYGKNFNTYVNDWRLKEVGRLRVKYKEKKVSMSKLAAAAGFGSYHSYRRALVKNEKKNDHG